MGPASTTYFSGSEEDFACCRPHCGRMEMTERSFLLGTWYSREAKRIMLWRHGSVRKRIILLTCVGRRHRTGVVARSRKYDVALQAFEEGIKTIRGTRQLFGRDCRSNLLGKPPTER
jgi:hypothetical protein